MPCDARHARPGRQPATAAAPLLLLVALLACAGPQRAAGAAELPADLASKPLIDQLLARKAFLGEFLKGEEWKGYLAAQHARFSRPSSQRGVLIVAGNRDMFANAAVTLIMLRRTLHSSIPVEIVFFGPKEAPPPELRELFSALNNTDFSNGAGTTAGDGSDGKGAGGGGPVFLTDAFEAAPPNATVSAHRMPPDGIRSFVAKVYALTHVTRFQQVLLLDADSMPLVDPLLLFHIPIFQRAGSLFWPDLWHSAWVNATIYSLVGGMAQAPWAGKHTHRLVDSGQILLDRLKHAEVLEYLWLLNSHHEWVYKHMHGDKDTFLLAFAMAQRLTAFKQVPCFARDAMRYVPGHEHVFHHLGMVQSVPPATLAAALRHAQRSHATGGSVASAGASHVGRVSHVGRMLLGALPGAAAAAGAADATAPNSHDSSHDGHDGHDGHDEALDGWQLLGLQRPRPSRPSRRLAQPGAGDAAGYDAADDRIDEVPKPAPGAGVPAAQGGGGAHAVALPAATARRNSRHVGVPVVFHRTSFNSKFFPDCLSGDKIKKHYCEVEYVSVPISNDQAAHSIKAHMYAFNEDQIDPRFFFTHCAALANATGVTPPAPPAASPAPAAAAGHRRLAGALSLPGQAAAGGGGSEAAAPPRWWQPAAERLAAVVQRGRALLALAAGPLDRRAALVRRQYSVLGAFGLPPEFECEQLPVGESAMPLTVMPVQVFTHMQGVLVASYQAFAEVRQKLKLAVRRRR